jgi:uncharacterized membrane protein YccC
MHGLEWIDHQSSRLLFAIRIWVAVCLALGVAFWLQLDGASSAGVCVAILALQTRGQVIEKAIYRMIGTIIGGGVAIAIAGTFAQTPNLYNLAYSLWLGLCVFAAGFLDGNRAYAAILSGYTVSIVAIPQIDAPGLVFPSAIGRVAAILIGILAVTLVNSLFLVPGITEKVLEQLASIRLRVRKFCETHHQFETGQDPDAEAAALLKSIADQHQMIALLSTETLVGVCHSAAARGVASALASQVISARQLIAAKPLQGDEFEEITHSRLLDCLHDSEAAERIATEALRAGTWFPNAPRMPIYLPWENAARNGFRAFMASALTGCLFVQLSWAESALAWQFVGIVICLSGSMPDSRVLAKAAFVAMPAAVAAAGFTIFVLLDGVDAFPLLCLGLMPSVMIGILLLTSPSRHVSLIGALFTVFTLVVMAPSNPPDYDAATYLETGFLMVVATSIVFVSAEVLLPVGDRNRRVWILRSCRNALTKVLCRSESHVAAEDILLDASRLAALPASAELGGDNHTSDLATIFWLMDMRYVTHRLWRGLVRLSASDVRRFHPFKSDAATALRRGDPALLRRIARLLAKCENPAAREVAADVALAAQMMEMSPAGGGEASAGP